MRNLFNEIESRVPSMHGWATKEKAFRLAAMVLAIRPRVVTECGVFGGRSALPMALALKENGFGKLIAIDAWDAGVSASTEEGENKKWWASVNHDEILRSFRQSIDEWGVKDFVEVVKAKTDDVEPMQCEVLHIDASHSIQAKVDVERFSPLVSSGGFLILDDLNWISQGVCKAHEAAIKIGFRELYRVEGLEKETNMTNDWCVMQRL